MTQQAILLPAIAMVALTIAVYLRMYAMRIGQMKRERIHPQSVATSAQANARLTDSRAADNLRNLFELPVLFYLALLVSAVTGVATTTTLVLAWSFVALRVAHSVIQCGYNKVMHRFKVHFSGFIVLCALWVQLAFMSYR